MWRLGGSVAPTSKVIVLWIGCINAIKSIFNSVEIISDLLITKMLKVAITQLAM